MKAVSLSRQGSRSEMNEDACLALPAKGVFVVADGVGGGPAGELASRAIVDGLYADLNRIGVLPSIETICHSIHRANSKILQLAMANGFEGMASTLVLTWFDASKLTCFHAGDSRIYRYRRGDLSQLTDDHTKSVKRSATQSKQMVTRALGVKADVDVEISQWDHQKADVVLLMSDGISDPLQELDMVAILSSAQMSMAEKASALVAASEEKGCKDDKTIVLVFD